MSDTATPAGTEAPAQGTEGTGTETAETPTVEELLAKVEELTGHSRKWEDRAKANKEAADRLAEIEREKMTDAERAEADKAANAARFAEVEKERDEAVAALARYKVATEFGLTPEDAEALSSISDEATLRSLAERLAGRSPAGTVRPNPAQGKGPQKAPSTPAEAFAEAMSDLF